SDGLSRARGGDRGGRDTFGARGRCGRVRRPLGRARGVGRRARRPAPKPRRRPRHGPARARRRRRALQPPRHGRRVRAPVRAGGASMAAPPVEELSPGGAHVFWTPVPAALEGGLAQAYWDLLEEPERERHDRYLFAPRRREYLLTRALVRTTLSRYADVDP